MSKFMVGDMVMITGIGSIEPNKVMMPSEFGFYYYDNGGDAEYCADSAARLDKSSSSRLAETKKSISLHISVGDPDKDECISSIDMDRVPVDVAESMIKLLLMEYK